MIKSLILIAHGSRHSKANDEIHLLTKTLSQLSALQHFSKINHAFLEFASPTIEETAQQQISQQCTDITFFPYFLSRGQHVSADIPNIINTLKITYPSLTLTLYPPLGVSDKIPQLIADLLNNPLTF